MDWWEVGMFRDSNMGRESLLVGGDDVGPSCLRKDACKMEKGCAGSKSD
jgi:hypothetical protein